MLLQKAFALTLLIHFLGTWWLFAGSFRALADWKRTGVADPLWQTIWAWVLQPLSILRCISFDWALGPSGYFYFFMLPWMIIVAFLFRASDAALFAVDTVKHLTDQWSQRPNCGISSGCLPRHSCRGLSLSR
jgi:hypothetical protein